eukprot:3270445-Prymnesium_polylepis.1
MGGARAVDLSELSDEHPAHVALVVTQHDRALDVVSKAGDLCHAQAQDRNEGCQRGRGLGLNTALAGRGSCWGLNMALSSEKPRSAAAELGAIENTMRAALAQVGMTGLLRRHQPCSCWVYSLMSALLNGPLACALTR